MRSIFIILLLSAALFNTAMADGVVSLHGKINAPVNDSIYISYNNDRIAYDPITQNIKLNNDGSFSASLPVKETFTIIKLRHGKRQAELAVETGYDLELSADGKLFDSSLSYTGKGSEVANFSALHTREFGLIDAYASKGQAQTDTVARFKTIVQEMEAKELAFLEAHKTALPTAFISYWKNYYKYYGYFAMLQYPYQHEVIKQQTYNIGSISPASYGILKYVPEAFSDSLLGIPTYRVYLDQLYRVKLMGAGYMNENNDKKRYRQEDSIISMDYKRLPKASAEYAIASLLYAYARSYPAERTEKLLFTYKKRYPESEYVMAIERQVAITKRLAKGQKAMDFEIHTPQNSVSLKLSDLKGKVVLLTFWSGAYRQGITDISVSRKLFAQYKDSGVAFVYVSIDESDAQWKTEIEKYKVPGIHTRIDGWKSLLAQLYGIQAVPTFFLIDKKGNFALDHTPLPRQGKLLTDEIERLLKE